MHIRDHSKPTIRSQGDKQVL